MSNTGYKILARFCREKGLTEENKEGILLGMHIMALQTEKWLDNEDHANAYRMDTWDESGFSGWREIYGHTKGFLEAQQPEESEQEMKERLQKNYEKVNSEKYEESDVSDMEVTDDEFEVVDKEDEDSDKELEWTPYTFENVEYLVGPEADLGRVVLETEDYQPVGVFEDEKIVFEDNLQVADHFQRVRESTIPEDPDEAIDLMTCFIEDNYRDKGLWWGLQEGKAAGDVPASLRFFYPPAEAGGAPSKNPRKSFHFGTCRTRQSWQSLPENILGKNMGEVMKEIESLL